jgi:enoyl-CoA hydratase
MATSHARREDVDGIVTITFTRDDKLNAVSPEMFDLIADAVDDLANNDALRVLVITAEGRYFTAGNDIASMAFDAGQGADGALRSSTMRLQYRRAAHHDLFDEMERVEKPIILAPQSHCFGVGIEMGLSCDFRLASDAATFNLPEVRNLATVPGAGGISRLTRIVGPHWARWLAMAGQTVDAQTALTMGLVHAVYPAAEFQERVQAFASDLASQPGEAVGLAKVIIQLADETDRRSAREIDRVAQSLVLMSPDFRDRMEAFLARSKKR